MFNQYIMGYWYPSIPSLTNILQNDTGGMIEDAKKDRIINGVKKDDEVLVIYNPVAGGMPVLWSFSDRDGDKVKKYGLDDLKRTPNKFYVESNKKANNWYSFVLMPLPSPAPGVDESAFVTSGETEGTPLRLEDEDTPIDIGGSG
nr:hypothetical protein [Tanacetum cinerariifolium]